MKQSAGILLYRSPQKKIEFFLVHPGGPFWAKKDAGAWSIPKGEFLENEDPITVAKREFEEETGSPLPGNSTMELQPVKLKSGKVIHAWAAEGDLDASTITSNTFELEWPPKSKKMMVIPEVDKAAWFSPEEAKIKINPAQATLIDELLSRINV